MNENVTAFTFCMNNFCSGSKYTEKKINFKWPFIAAGGKGTTLEKTKNESSPKNLPIPRTEVVFIKWKITWSEWRNSKRAKKPLKNFSSEPICTFVNWRLFLANFRVVFWKKHSWRWAGNLESLGLTNGKGFTGLARASILWNSTARTKFCWGIKVNLVIGNANVLCMWEQMTEAMC